MKRAVLVLAFACRKDTAEPPPAPVHHEDRAEPAVAEPPLSLAVTVDGQSQTWGPDVFEHAPHFTATNNGGQGRDAWSLRELAKTVGPTARVITVIGDKQLAIDAAAWADPAKTPIVHRTRRGALKFRWTDAAGTWSEAEVKDVTGLALTK